MNIINSLRPSSIYVSNFCNIIWIEKSEWILIMLTKSTPAQELTNFSDAQNILSPYEAVF